MKTGEENKTQINTIPKTMAQSKKYIDVIGIAEEE